MKNLASPSAYSFGATKFGVGLKGDGIASASAKGLYGQRWAAGTNTISGFGIATLNSLSPSVDCGILRNAGASGQGVSLVIVPSTKAILPLLTGVSWTGANSRTDSSITTGVPWFFGFYYSPAEGFWVYSAPVGKSAQRIGTVLYTGSAVSPAGSEALYIGGVEYSGGSTAPIPGVLHLVGLSNKPVPRQWFESLSLDPWQLFSPQRQVSYFFPATGITPLVSRRVWTQQPPAATAGVNWRNPITQGLLALLDPRTGAELVRGSGLVGTRKTLPALGAGVATDRNSTGYLGVTPPTSASSPSAYLDIASGDITVFAVCAQIGAAANSNTLFGRFKGSSPPNYSVGLHTGTFNGPYTQLGTYSYSPGTASVQRLNEAIPVAVVGQSGTAYTYFRGEFVNSGAYTQTAYEYDGSGGRAVSIGSGGTGSALVGVCYFGAIWTRALSATEIATLSANPWQLFSPQRLISYFGTAGGGTIYNLSLSDSSTGSDGTALTLFLYPSVADASTANDALANTVTFNPSVADSSTANDALANTVTFNPSVADSSTAGDSIDGGLVFNPGVTDSSTAGDSIAGGLAFNPSVADASTANDALTNTITFNPSVVDASTGSDNITTTATLNVGAADASTAGDVLDGLLLITAAVTDASSASDALAGGLAYNPSVADASTASDVTVASPAYAGNVFEAVAVLDSISTTAIQNVFVLDTATAVDSILTGGAQTVFVTETVTLADASSSRFLWEAIDTSQTPGWSNISTTQTANWSSITTTQTANWQPVNTGS